MMKLKCLGAALFSMVLLTGCGGSDAEDIKAEDLTGTWVQTLSDGTETLTLYEDMTYTMVIELGGAFPVTTESSDTWSISGNTISINYSKYNTVSTYSVKLDGSTMTWDTGDSTIIYYKQS